jgi:hypothetical protein
MGPASAGAIAIPKLGISASRASSKVLAVLWWLIFLGLLSLVAVLEYQSQSREPDGCRAAIADENGRLLSTESGAAICVE